VARFKFELEAVLEHRKRLEQERQKAVAELESQRVGLEGIIRRCQEGLVHEKEEMKALLKGADMRGVRFQIAAAGRLTASAQRAVLELAGLHKRLEAARVLLLDAARRRKAVELLKERRFEEWMRHQNKLEAEAMDELAVMRAGQGDRDL